MGSRDPRVDAYIEKSADFAKPILTYIRETVHAACPDCQETMKWSFPHFDYKGMLCSMAAFKHHATFGFWKGSLVLGRGRDADAMGQFGRITSLEDLPPKKALAGYIKKAMELNDDGVKVERKPSVRAKAPLRVPSDLAAALKKNKTARATFEALSPSHQREYIEWITEAKTDATRARRLATTIEWLVEGKARSWKYMSR
jgi:hypothetical protein